MLLHSSKFSTHIFALFLLPFCFYFFIFSFYFFFFFCQCFHIFVSILLLFSSLYFPCLGFFLYLYSTNITFESRNEKVILFFIKLKKKKSCFRATSSILHNKLLLI